MCNVDNCSEKIQEYDRKKSARADFCIEKSLFVSRFAIEFSELRGLLG